MRLFQWRSRPVQSRQLKRAVLVSLVHIRPPPPVEDLAPPTAEKATENLSAEDGCSTNTT